MADKFKDECGVFGISGHPEAANLTYLGLYALQHRGQESAGIASSDGKRVSLSRAMGYVADSFDEDKLAELSGSLAIGHVRYSTAGESNLVNAQPILIDCSHGEISLCHNGNIVNATELRQQLVQEGSISKPIAIQKLSCIFTHGLKRQRLRMQLSSLCRKFVVRFLL